MRPLPSASSTELVIDCNPSMETSLLHCCMERCCFHWYQEAIVFIVALLRNCKNFALSIVAATLTLLGQGNLTYATPPRKLNMSHCPLLKAARPEQPPRYGTSLPTWATIIFALGWPWTRWTTLSIRVVLWWASSGCARELKELGRYSERYWLARGTREFIRWTMKTFDHRG
jgi:hypothetical protein